MNVAGLTDRRDKLEPRTHHLLLILADISGYTEFMLANQLTLVHGQQLITNLIEAIIGEIEIPLELKEIEGDAVFLYAVHPGDDERWRQVCDEVARKLFRFFEAFTKSLVASAESTVCLCGTCQNVDKLKLKIVVHSGEALFHSIDRFRDVSGVDVILAHRLLKNSVPSDEYLLLTEAAAKELRFPEEIRFEKGSEAYDGFGSVATRVHHLADPREAERERFHAAPAPLVIGRAFLRNLGEVLATFPAIAKSAELTDRNEVASSPLRRILFAVIAALSLPVEILLVALVTPLRVVQRRRRLASRPR